MIRQLRTANIECGVHYIPLHLFPYYQKTYGYQIGDFPSAESVYKQAISLPMHALLDSDDVRTVANALKQLIEDAC